MKKRILHIFLFAAALALGVLGTLLFSLSHQPYAAVFFLVFLSIKGILLLKKP